MSGDISKVVYRGGFWGVVFSGGSFWTPSGLKNRTPKTSPEKPHPKKLHPKKRTPKNAQKWGFFENGTPKSKG